MSAWTLDATGMTSASGMPSVARANIHLTTVMIAELLIELLL